MKGVPFMNKTERDHMLLFSKERVAGLYRYRLYFTPISSLRDDTPRVFRLLVRTPFAFNKFEVGRIYKLSYSNIHIQSFEPRDEFNLQEEDYSRLIETRDIKFMDKKTSAALRQSDQPGSVKDRYYSFDEMKQIVNYKQDFLTSVAVTAFSGSLTGLALLLPFVIYALLLRIIIGSTLTVAGFTSKALSLPILGIGALPVTIYVMSILFALSELALLRIDFTKWNLIKKYTLSWGGIRKSMFLELSDIRYFKKFGIGAGIALVVSILIALIV
jgi:hypothetical protein